MDKEYILFCLDDRIEDLRVRYRAAVHCKTEFNEDLSAGTAAVYRSDYKQQLNLCTLVRELVLQTPKQTCELSSDAREGLDKLTLPMERHRRLKE